MKDKRVFPGIKNVNVMPKKRAVSAPPVDHRHEKFQLGQNPMKEAPFEKSLILLEREERKLAREKYIKGIQGRDGGCLIGREHEEYIAH